MGGCAHIIKGVVKDEVLQAGPDKKGFLARLFGGTKSDHIVRSDFGDSVLIDIPCRGLSKKLHQKFVEYLERKLNQPDKATKYIFDAYLGVARSDTYIRGEEKDGACSWYVQFTFSGCAGMAEISAEVCAHWAETWVHDHLDDVIRPMLEEYGFEASNQLDSLQNGYAFITVTLDDQDVYASLGEDGEIELDGAFYEELSEDYEQFNERMKKLYGHKAPLRECECQLCEQQKLSEISTL